MLTDSLFLIGSLSDLNADPTDPSETVDSFFSDHEYFKSIEIGWTPSQDRIYIDNLGEIYLDGEPVRVWVIQSRIRDLLAGSTGKSVLVVTDDGVPAGRLVEVVDQARLAGATDVGVATVEEAGAG